MLRVQVKLKASFAREDEPRATGLWGRMGWGKEDEDDNRPIHERYGARTRFKAWFRRHHIRFRAHVMPYNSGLTAGQALVSPFFQDRDEELRVAEPAAELETLFPRCDYKQTLEPDSSGQV